jgi:hypothetical protein
MSQALVSVLSSSQSQLINHLSVFLTLSMNHQPLLPSVYSQGLTSLSLVTRSLM